MRFLPPLFFVPSLTLNNICYGFATVQPPIHKTRDHVVGIRQGYITRAPLVVLAVFLCIYTRPPWAQPVRPGIRLNTGGDAPV